VFTGAQVQGFWPSQLAKGLFCANKVWCPSGWIQKISVRATLLILSPKFAADFSGTGSSVCS